MSAALEQLLAALVACDSTNPGLVPGGAGEGAVAALIAAELADCGLEVEVSGVLPGPTSSAGCAAPVVGRRCCSAATATWSRHRLRCSPRACATAACSGAGRATMKAGLVAGLAAARRLAPEPQAGDVIVAAVVDEEWLSAGAEALVESVSAEAAIVLESTQLDVVTEHGGFAWFELESTGVEAAGDDTEHGRDAIAHLEAALSEIAALDHRLAAGPSEPYGRPSVHVGTIAGGVQLSACRPRDRGRRALPDRVRAARRRARRARRRGRAHARPSPGSSWPCASC